MGPKAKGRRDFLGTDKPAPDDGAAAYESHMNFVRFVKRFPLLFTPVLLWGCQAMPPAAPPRTGVQDLSRLVSAYEAATHQRQSAFASERLPLRWKHQQAMRRLAEECDALLAQTPGQVDAVRLTGEGEARHDATPANPAEFRGALQNLRDAAVQENVAKVRARYAAVLETAAIARRPAP